MAASKREASGEEFLQWLDNRYREQKHKHSPAEEPSPTELAMSPAERAFNAVLDHPRPVAVFVGAIVLGVAAWFVWPAEPPPQKREVETFSGVWVSDTSGNAHRHKEWEAETRRSKLIAAVVAAALGAGIGWAATGATGRGSGRGS